METDAQVKQDIIAEPTSAPSVKVRAKSGWIALAGDAEWDYQRQRAREAVRDPMGCDRCE